MPIRMPKSHQRSRYHEYLGALGLSLALLVVVVVVQNRALHEIGDDIQTSRQTEISTMKNISKSIVLTPAVTTFPEVGAAEESPEKEKHSKRHKEPADKDSVHKVQEISLIGERESGTRWSYSFISQCFNHTLTVRDRLVRYKHWFQADVPTTHKKVPTLVIAQFRDPYYWVEAMRKVPHHAPMHWKQKWETYVTTPWTMDPRPGNDTDVVKEYRRMTGLAEGDFTNYSDIQCQNYFAYNEIVSCLRRPYGNLVDENPKMKHYSHHQPMYELRNDGSGLAYSSVIDLRADKIKNFLSIADWDWVVDLYPVKYEDLVSKGTASIIDYIAEVTGVSPSKECKLYPPQDRPKRRIRSDYAAWMTQHVDWDTEKMIGYQPWRRKPRKVNDKAAT